ncbi:hypothetical protein C0J52_08671 [Blattella germanica]|nr:hypothetical protein C0J52_08671 [Blattella germanica]
MKNFQAQVIVITAAILLHQCAGRPEYEDCNRKIRRQILESCSSEKGKRSAEYDTPSLPMHDEPLQNAPSSALLGRILGVPSQWTADDVAVNNANRQVKRSPETIRQLMIDCCLANCSPDRFLGMC